jgi:hypothetical protein
VATQFLCELSIFGVCLRDRADEDIRAETDAAQELVLPKPSTTDRGVRQVRGEKQNSHVVVFRRK